MKSQKQILDIIEKGRESQCLDGRDYNRLSNYFPVSEWKLFGFEPTEEGKEKFKPKEWTEENILEDLKSDLEFAFEKALNCRGISSGLMFETIKMWMWILDDELENFDEYAMYGLPLYKAVALKYGFDNPIGDDNGNEDKYDEH